MKCNYVLICIALIISSVKCSQKETYTMEGRKPIFGYSGTYIPSVSSNDLSKWSITIIVEPKTPSRGPRDPNTGGPNNPKNPPPPPDPFDDPYNWGLFGPQGQDQERESASDPVKSPPPPPPTDEPYFTPNPRQDFVSVIERDCGEKIRVGMDSATKRSIIENYPILSYGRCVDELNTLCLGEPDLQSLVMSNFSSYKYPVMIELYKSFDVYDDEIAAIQRQVSTRDTPFKTVKPIIDGLVQASRVRRRALDAMPSIGDHCRELANTRKSIDLLGHPSRKLAPDQVTYDQWKKTTFPPALSSDIKDLQSWMEYYEGMSSAVSSELMNRDEYGRLQMDDQAKQEQDKSISALGLTKDFLNNTGTRIHHETKIEILNAVKQFEKNVVDNPRLGVIKDQIETILRMALMKNQRGDIGQPNDLLIMARMMSLMARSREWGFPLNLPISFADPTDPQVRNSLLESHSLYWLSSFRSLLGNIPSYGDYLERFCNHLQHCDICKHHGNCGYIKIPNPIDADRCKIHVQNERRRKREQEEQEKKRLEEQERQIKEEIERCKEELRKLEMSPLEIMQRRAYIQNREREWHEQRQKKIDEMENGQLHQEALTDKASKMIADQGLSTRPFEEFVPSAEQQVLQNEFVELANESAELHRLNDPLLSFPLPDFMLELVEAGGRLVVANDMQSAILIADTGGALREYGRAFEMGVAKGIIRAGQDLAGFISHPKESFNELKNALCNVGYQLGRLLHVVGDFAFSYELGYKDQLQAWERGERNAQALCNDLSAFYQALKDHCDATPGPKLLEEVTEATVSAYAKAQILGATLKFAGEGVNAVSDSISKASSFSDIPPYTISPNGTVSISYVASQTVSEAATGAQSIAGLGLYAVVSGSGSGGSDKDTYRFGKFEPAPYHHHQSKGGKGRGAKSPGPKDGQVALDNSVKIGGNTDSRVAINNGQFVVFDKTLSTPTNPVFHGHIREWNELTQKMKNVLRDAGLVEFLKKGNDYRILNEILD